MLVYKNFDVVPGISVDMDFPLVDDTFIKIDPTGFNFKLEVFNPDLRLRFIANTGFVTSLGSASRTLSDSETLTFKQGLLQYRLVSRDLNNKSVLRYKGFLTCAEPKYSELADPTNTNTVLPDGSIYMTTPGPIILGMWYSVSNYQRILVSGVGRVGMDLRNNVGGITISSEFYNNTVNEQNEWIPYVGQSTSFRINQIFGANTLQYLP